MCEEKESLRAHRYGKGSFEVVVLLYEAVERLILRCKKCNATETVIDDDLTEEAIDEALDRWVNKHICSESR